MGTTKRQFFRILDSIDTNRASYYYLDTCNEPQSHCRYQNKSAKYVLYLTTQDQEIILHEGWFFKGTHEDKKKELIKKFTNWANDWKRLKTDGVVQVSTIKPAS